MPRISSSAPAAHTLAVAGLAVTGIAVTGIAVTGIAVALVPEGCGASVGGAGPSRRRAGRLPCWSPWRVTVVLGKRR